MSEALSDAVRLSRIGFIPKVILTKLPCLLIRNPNPQSRLASQNLLHQDHLTLAQWPQGTSVFKAGYTPVQGKLIFWCVHKISHQNRLRWSSQGKILSLRSLKTHLSCSLGGELCMCTVSMFAVLRGKLFLSSLRCPVVLVLGAGIIVI